MYAGSNPTYFAKMALILILLLSLALLNQFSALGGFAHGFKLVLIKSSLAFAAFVCCSFLHEHWLERVIPLGYVASLVLLLGVEVAGVTVKGATRWIHLGPLSIQPSELAKIFTPLMSAHMLYWMHLQPLWQMFITICLVAMLPGFLVLHQPDLGSAILIFCSGMAPLLVSRLPLWFFASIAGLFLAASPVLWHQLRPYQQERILTLIDPSRDPLGQGYHVQQSKIAIGSGQVLGKGWQDNTQGHYGFLPEHDTDFAFAVFAEEWGFLGSVGVIGAFWYFSYLLLEISLQARSYYAQLLCIALSAPWFMYVFINIGMITGLLPVVGVPLPFFTRGGTNLLSMLGSLGMIYGLNKKHSSAVLRA